MLNIFNALVNKENDLILHIMATSNFNCVLNSQAKLRNGQFE